MTQCGKSWRPRHESHVLNCDKRKAATVSSRTFQWFQSDAMMNESRDEIAINWSRLPMGGRVYHQQLNLCRLCQRSEPAPAPCPSVGISEHVSSELEP